MRLVRPAPLTLALIALVASASSLMSQTIDPRPAAGISRKLGGGSAPSQRIGELLPRRKARTGPPFSASGQEAEADKVTVDSQGYTGAENAIYSPRPRTVFVAYKRFLRDPIEPGGDLVAAQLRVARSADGGKNWSLDVVDATAGEPGDVVDQSVAIGGDRDDTIYMAYLEQSEEVDANLLKVAKSTDAGKTWTIGRVSRQGGGGYVAIKVIDTKTVLIAAKKAGGTEPLRLYSTTDGGNSWTKSTIDTFGWYTGLDTSRSDRIWVSYFNPGATSLHSATSTSPAGPWVNAVVAGEGGDDDYAGLGNSLDVTRSGDVYVSYEDFQRSRGRSVVRVSKTSNLGESWSTNRVQAATFIGWNTAIRVIERSATTHAFVAYWYGRPNPELKGRVRIAHSEDGAETWSVTTIHERRYVDPYLDLAAPTPGVQYISYQARNTGGGTILRVARVDTTP